MQGIASEELGRLYREHAPALRLYVRQWLAGEYRMEMMGQTADDREVTYSARVLVPPPPDGKSLTAARAWKNAGIRDEQIPPPVAAAVGIDD